MGNTNSTHKSIIVREGGQLIYVNADQNKDTNTDEDINEEDWLVLPGTLKDYEEVEVNGRLFPLISEKKLRELKNSVNKIKESLASKKQEKKEHKDLILNTGDEDGTNKAKVHELKDSIHSLKKELKALKVGISNVTKLKKDYEKAKVS